MPDVQTADEAGIRILEASAWFALFAPANTPSTFIHRLTG